MIENLELEEEILNFKLQRIFKKVGDVENYFSYDNEEKHRGLQTYFHIDTKEYRIKKYFGLNEFCLTELITENEDKFTELLKLHLHDMIESIDEFAGDENYFVEQKKISTWKYAENLKNELEGFELYFNPKKYLQVTNGSFVIVNYCDFKINSDLAIFYNIFSDNFGSEARINGSPTVIYDFDSDTLNELEEKIEMNLIPQLKRIRSTC